MAADLVSIDRAVAEKALHLFRYVSDHGGGNSYPGGDCPSERVGPCPSCDARRLSEAFAAVIEATSAGELSHQSRMFFTQQGVIAAAADVMDARRPYVSAPYAAFLRELATLMRTTADTACTGDRYGVCEPAGPLSCPEHYLAFKVACAYLGRLASAPLTLR
jgi:hypothetical protein